MGRGSVRNRGHANGSAQNGRNSGRPNAEERARRAAAERSTQRREPTNWTAAVLLGALVIGGGGSLAMKAFSGFSRFFEPTYEVIDHTNTKALQDILFKGDPWVIFCGRKDAQGRVNNTYDGRSSLTAVKTMDTLAVKANYRFRVGLLDCSAPLPSGKNLYERFNLKPKSAKVTFWVANGNPPRMIDVRASSEYEIARLANQIANFVTLKVETLTSTKQLHKKCINYKRGCVVLIQKGNSLPAPKEAEVNTILKENRKIRYFKLDITQRQISLNLPPAMMGYPQVLYMRKAAVGEGVDRYYTYTYSVFDDEFEAKEVLRFIEEGQKADPNDSFWSELKEPLPRISKVITQTQNQPKKKPKANARASRKRARAKQKEEEEARKKKEQAARQETDKESDEEMYKRRRQKMDEDMLENAPQASVDDDDFDEPDEIEEEEEETIDLE
mmetsp:Transcript_8108/g.19896  ORF Transcript_8108/g.19896 Transcript_8108/m.19896 type:complete len:443 (-) Transcript_8108:132-1460(-)